MNIKVDFFKENFYKYIYLVLSLLGVFWLLSFFELYSNFANGNPSSNFGTTLFYKVLNDFWAAVLVGLVLLPIYMLVVSLIKRAGLIFFKIVFIVLVIGQFSLIKYSLATLINLGSDLLGYSLDDISLTVSSTESMSILSFIPFLIFPAIFILLYYFLNRHANRRSITLIFGVSVLIFGSLKLVVFKSVEAKYQNKMYYFASDIIRYQNEKMELQSFLLDGRNDYPLLKPFSETEDVLSPFFNIHKEKPNVVILIIEGLGSEFVGENTYHGFTPFLDSLIPKSLFWENFVSTTSRTFGIVPSLLGSLPFGEKGFLEIPTTPSHISLINVLKANGYTTTFFAGHPSNFDRKIKFLEYNGIDNVIDESKFGPEYIKTLENNGGFTWGYPDAEIFRKTLASLDNLKLPRLDIVMTLTNHEPFEFPLKEEYITAAEKILNSGQSFGIEKSEISNHMDIYSALLYTDTAIKNYIESYAKRPEFDNTIFIITGDHRLIPIPQKDKLCRYHVPLFIYSPLLKKTAKFKSISSHFDVAPSLISFLMNNYDFNTLDATAWIGKGLDTARHFRNIHQIPLMRYKGKISDFIYQDYLYSDGELFQINENFGTIKVIEEQLTKTISDSLTSFKKLNSYVTQKNRIYPDSLNIYSTPPVEFSKEQLTIIEKVTKDLKYDEIFMSAREIAFEKDYIKARLLCDYILNEFPNYSDARTLKGRTLAWEGKYSEAEYELLNVIKRSPYYQDSYVALFDLYWWSDQDKKSISLMEKAIEHKLDSPEIGFKMAKAYSRMNELDSANKIIDSIIELNPINIDYQNFKQSLAQ